MILPTFKHRSYEAEIIDDLSFSGEELIPTFRAIESINYWLGGNKVSIRGVKKVLKSKTLATPSEKIRILDLGCGSGDGLRALADWGKKQKIDLDLAGWDANPHIIELAQDNQVNMLISSSKSLTFLMKGYTTTIMILSSVVCFCIILRRLK